jgi:hypothetical protein
MKLSGRTPKCLPHCLSSGRSKRAFHVLPPVPHIRGQKLYLIPPLELPFANTRDGAATADGYEEMGHSWCSIVNEAIWIPTLLTSSAFSSFTILGGGKAFTECRRQLQPTHVVAIEPAASDRELRAAATCCRECWREGENMVGDIDSLYWSAYYREPGTHFVLAVFLAIPIDCSFKDTKRPVLDILHKKITKKTAIIHVRFNQNIIHASLILNRKQQVNSDFK